ncbi:MAG: HAMP domain-containing protein, partial [Thermodesulfovibrionales bacterium]|nr:HAMP domain-containing protein [Thermodesulfovibrionales bacterium]
MSLRAKLTVFTIFFFLITAALIAGSFLVFSRLSNTFDIQRSLTKEHNMHDDWKSSIVSVVMAAEGWTVTGEAKFQRRYKQRLKEAYTFFNGLPEAVQNKEEVKAIRADFDKMKEFAGAIMSAKQPVGDIHVLFALRMLKDKEREAYEKLGAIHSESVLKLTNTIAQGERIERQMGFYLVVLFGLSSLAIMSLIIFMKRIITAPFDGLMKATKKISEGELDYRIDSGRRDEFGIIADRFDEMVEKLQRSILKNAELYEIEQLSESQAVEAKKRMEILFYSVQGGIITVGRGYEILSANRFVKGWTDMAVEQLTGKNALDVFHDKEGICPHCAAKATFETGQVNSITQSRGMNYAELTSYPVKDDAGNVIECVVFIEDITDRVLYHEEILSLYKEVAQTKEYLESLIENSADAIVTSDLDGNITSWNY